MRAMSSVTSLDLVKTGYTWREAIPLSEFRANTAAMIDLVERGETVRILRHGKPVADLVPTKPQAEQKVPRWKLPIEPLNIKWPEGMSGAKMIIEERENARF